jgi:hypothetical protein
MRLPELVQAFVNEGRKHTDQVTVNPVSITKLKTKENSTLKRKEGGSMIVVTVGPKLSACIHLYKTEVEN